MEEGAVGSNEHSGILLGEEGISYVDQSVKVDSPFYILILSGNIWENIWDRVLSRK